MLNTLYLRTFLAVVDAGNYTAAAEQLHMSQPAVSQHIRALEDQLGSVRLFRRIGQRMVTTHAGEELLAAAREMMVLSERTEQNIRALRGQVSGRVSIGCTTNSGEYLLPLLLAECHRRFPAIQLVVQVAPAEALLLALTQQGLSIVLLEESLRRRGLESRSIGREPLALLAPVDCPLVQHEEVQAGALRDYAFVLPQGGSPLRRTIEDHLRRRSVQPGDMQIVLECDSITATLQAVRGGIGLAFVPQTCLGLASDVHHINLSGTPLHQEWYVLRERGHSPRAVQELYAFLTSVEVHPVLEQCGLHMPE
jgi:DNA-binding transcriptional LysR family regulator